MAAPKSKSPMLWKALEDKIKLGPITKPDRFLRCYLRPIEAKASDVATILGQRPELYPRMGSKAESLKVEPYPLKSDPTYNPNTKVRGYVYDMQRYFEKNIEKYFFVRHSVGELPLPTMRTPVEETISTPRPPFVSV